MHARAPFAGVKSASSADPTKYTGDKKADAFMRFVQSEAGVWVGLPGQVKDFDELAKTFGKDPKGTVAKAEKVAAAAAEKDADSAKYYVKVTFVACRTFSLTLTQTHAPRAHMRTHMHRHIRTHTADVRATAARAQVMTKLAANADFVKKEVERLQKMIDDGSVKPNKKEQFGRRLNILSSFQ